MVWEENQGLKDQMVKDLREALKKKQETSAEERVRIASLLDKKDGEVRDLIATLEEERGAQPELMEIAKQQISKVQSEREKMEKVLREKDKKMKEMEERLQQQFEEEIQQIIKKYTATMEGTDERTIPKTRHQETSLDKEPKTVCFDPKAKKEEGTTRRRRRTMLPDMEWDYGYQHLWDGMEEYSNGEEYKKFRSMLRDEGESIPT